MAPTICFLRLAGKSVPRARPHNPAHSLKAVTESCRRKTLFFEECALRHPCFIAIALDVEIERRLNSRMTQNALHGLGLDLRLVRQPA